MSVCSNRNDTPGFFTGCSSATRDGCPCGTAVRKTPDQDAERLAALITEGLEPPEACRQLWGTRGGTA